MYVNAIAEKDVSVKLTDTVIEQVVMEGKASIYAYIHGLENKMYNDGKLPENATLSGIQWVVNDFTILGLSKDILRDATKKEVLTHGAICLLKDVLQLENK